MFEELTVNAFHAALRTGEMTSADLVDWYLARIEAHNTQGAELQAVVTVNPRARDEAAAADQHFSDTGRLTGPLHGVPVLVKDQVETAGLRTTFGSKLFENYVPEADGTLVTRLREAGAVILAKTSMCDFAAGWFSSSSMTDHTKNPYSPAREAGGSSSGTGAGLAANFGLVGIGEDTGGSIRIPASFNNLFGLRVTTGLVSRAGFAPLVHFQDTPGPMARTVADLARLLDSIVGFDPRDPFTAVAWPPPGSYTEALDQEIPFDAWRIGVLETGFGPAANPDAEPVNQVVRSAIGHLTDLGTATVPGLEIEKLGDWIADTSLYVRQSKADISRFLAQRPKAPVTDFAGIYDSGVFHPYNDLLHGIAEGPENPEDDPENLRLRLNQEHFRRLMLNLFATHRLDFLVYPSIQVVPPTRDELAAEKYRALTFPTNTVIGSQAGFPALTLPAGFTDSGLPVGMELLGTPLTERKMLQFAQAWEKSTQPRKAPVL
ncbi:amidase [Streptomyces sp. NPDC006012]|uniref:amidase n=1 Tax=Streptomyces sp. NPDC006012 TaxID=3364739 RepID=UPI0036CDFFA5